ncbi:hypothetical protein Y032_0299g1774 [Ancylostoma ceylanicum]|uniref:Uncharacterized protein n=1 Tax=Ancylostoma ceylanicum TaxID=53326 RepID=A0A016S4E8_9BILA|nr:hypothetical protein Y032_0299g1774 [Ancylostoma ceylanicum]
MTCALPLGSRSPNSRTPFCFLSLRDDPEMRKSRTTDHGLSQVLAADFELVDPNVHRRLKDRVEIYRVIYACCSIACAAVFPELSKEKQQNMFVVNGDVFCHNRNGMVAQSGYV